jgi:hypothetical protein
VEAETGRAISSSLTFPIRISQRVVHFGKTNKLQYLGGAALSPQSGVTYSCLKPAKRCPHHQQRSGGQSNITAIKRYFCSEYACMMVPRPPSQL